MIHRFRVQHFKSIVDVTVDLSETTVLVGKIGTGKSNFVESLRSLRDVLSLQPGTMSPQQIADETHRWNQLRPATNQGAPTSFEIEFSLPGIEHKFEYRLTFRVDNSNPIAVEEYLRLGNRTLFHQQRLEEQGRQHEAEWVVEPNLLDVPTPGRVALGRIPSMTEVVIAFTALTSGIGYYVFPDKVLCVGKSNQKTSGLDDTATNYLDAQKDILLNLRDLNARRSIVATVKRLKPSVSSVELDNIQKPGHIVVGHSVNGKTLSLELSQESAGIRRFYAHLLALYQQPPKQTLIFEHPEDGIHPGALSLLAEEFKAAPQNGRGQVILTTHSPEFLDHFDSDQIRVVELKGFETRIGLVSDEQREAIQENLLGAGELLTVDPARMQPHSSETAGA